MNCSCLKKTLDNCLFLEIKGAVLYTYCYCKWFLWFVITVVWYITLNNLERKHRAAPRGRGRWEIAPGPYCLKGSHNAYLFIKTRKRANIF